MIGTNKKDATETVELLLEDARAGLLRRESDERLESLLAARGVEVVTYAGWEAIDVEERTRGEPQGRPRVKLCTWDELLAAAQADREPSPDRGSQRAADADALGRRSSAGRVPLRDAASCREHLRR